MPFKIISSSKEKVISLLLLIKLINYLSMGKSFEFIISTLTVHISCPKANNFE